MEGTAAEFQRRKAALKKQRKFRGLLQQARRECEALDAGRYVPQTAAKRIGLPLRPVPKRLRPKCGAKRRDGKKCQAYAVNGSRRCRMHGGLSTGPKTEAGRAAIAEANRRRAERKRQEAEARERGEAAVGIRAIAAA